MLFFEAFEELHVGEELHRLFEEAEVERVVASRSHHLIKIHIKHRRLLSYRNIKTMEYQMKKQLFLGTPESVALIPAFTLSESYTPEKLMPMYLDSMIEELKEESILEANILRSAEWHFEGDVLHLTCEDNSVIKQKTPELKEKLLYIFNDRCGFSISVVYDYYEPEKKEEEEPVFYTPGRLMQERGELARERLKGNTASSGAGNFENTAGEASDDKKTFEPKKVSGEKPAYKRSFRKLPEDPDIFYGRPFDGETTPIRDIQDEVGEVVIQGKVTFVEARELRNEKTLLIFNVTDFTDTIAGKLFLKNEQTAEVTEKLTKGAFIRLKGMALLDRYDHEVGISSIVGIKTISDFTSVRMDNSTEKRVELHAHTLMSDMDAVVDVKTMIKRAKAWGHKAIAITDHGVVQAFTDASHSLDKGDDFKIIYGCEAYLVDDLKNIVENDRGQSLDAPCVVFDIETTGFGPVKDAIIEIGAVKVVDGQITEKYSTFVNPDRPIPFEIEQLTGISDEMVLPYPMIDKILPEFLAFCEGCVLVAHNAGFDVSFITQKAKMLGISTDFTVVDTVGMARALLPDLNKFKLNVVAKALDISLENHHRAVDDAGATGEIFVKFIEMLKEQEIFTLSQLDELSKASPEVIKKLPTHHAVILAKNDTGRINLYKLVSLSHIDYYSRRPRIPKSVFEENREGLMIGSACEAGELYQAILRGQSQEEINRLVNFYDYLEIQPLGNNAFMVREEKYNDIQSEEDLIAINKKIVALGEEFNKPVVATCDVHFLDPEDELYRRIIMAGKGFKDADMQAPLYLRTTEEMLSEFSYLGEEKAREVVITNTNIIADRIERISPVRPDKCPPVIENSAETLTQICYDKAHSMYGPNLPEIVEARLKKELNSIIGNGFAVMYIIAQKLVWKSNEDGYLVGSRGSVGSSFVATMSGITEVNPLPAHYYCTNCFYSDFDSEEVKAYAGRSGCDMPDKLCPVCGKPLSKDGHEIPFETFLGFYGDKEPDIDLNFSGEYQCHAHDYTEVIFGKGQTFRAGTIGTLAEKTAYGYVYKYYEEREQHRRRAEMEREAEGCVGVRRTTGQHPGGIIVLPHGEEIYSFTPVQHPANDMTTSTITTHFDYHSIDHNLLKLDILGHDDPTMIRMLEDLTGVDAKSIRLDDEKVLSLFDNLSALGITPGDLDGCDLGSLGIPEFGTDFVMQMLRDTKPKTFSDLVRISGLSHGTDVWLNNAQYFISQGNCTLSTAICTRDDIMTFLIHTGVENGLAFKIMESVRKGKGLKPEMEEAMRAAGVPEWYMESCRRIKYMFPKAHAAAYVMMAFRIAWFKVYEPLAYYAAYFSIRASAFNYELMCQGREKLEYYLADFKRRSNELSKKEQDTVKDMKIVQEMYARGFEFMPIDLYRAKARHFQIIDGKIMPSLSSIDGMGDKAAEAVVDAAAEGKFLSQDDFRQRSKVSTTIVDKMVELGILEGLPISNQMSLLDFL
ncbi:PolC-type DNA polymerase III [Acetivibrio ethanolgignens]|uniref:DNA polymerase III PolC-type n=1 Tax=Acetivibrio ethanolgignens TaxID=290052 RepID=A0A0V8QJD2_9FIRM|nr:PolC-type DNA polymerase III [Acetivibrio ethanolgignens]KSV60664.1 DNA polymerase III subunit alpha [Acetivibrio ethanolgignens]